MLAAGNKLRPFSKANPQSSKANDGETSMKRQRGRGRRPGGGGHQHGNHSNPNRPMESNGPDNTKVRGPAAVVYERYLQYARDAASSGDRVLSENYLQHADHYFRLLRQMQPAAPPQQPDRYAGDGDFEGDEEGGPESEAAEEGEGSRVASQSGEDQFDADTQQEPREPRNFDRDRDGDPRRRRGRRNRFRPGGPEGGEATDAGEAEAAGDSYQGERRASEETEGRRDRENFRRDRPPREERRPREQADDREKAPEGFSHGPKPAFLGGD